MTQSNLNRWMYRVVRRMLPGMSAASLKDTAGRYESELADREFVYTFQEKGKKPFQARVEFERSGFCHLFSIGSIVSKVTPDVEQFCGMKGWRNIQDGKITLSMLRKLDPAEFQYYQNEFQMLDQMIETVSHPQAVRFDPKKVSGSRLEADILLYNIYGSRTVHVGLSQDRKTGRWFARSYFVRENGRDKEYPTRYIANMKPLSVRVKVSSKKA